MTCSKFIDAEQLPLLIKVLSITADEESSVMTNFERADHQAYQMLITWRSRPHNNSKQILLEALGASDLHEAAKK